MNKLNEFVSAMDQIRGTGSNGEDPMPGLPEEHRDRISVAVFVRRLWEMVTEGVIAHWHRTGLAIVTDVRLYEANVLRLYSTYNRTNKFSLFHRQLTCHGFIRLTTDHLDDCLAADPRLAVYFHGCFRRDKPDLLWKIRSFRQIEIGDRPNTQDSWVSGRATNVSGPHIVEKGSNQYRVRSTSQPSTRIQQAFVDVTRQPFRRSRTPPTARSSRKRSRPESTDTHRLPSQAIPIGRLPEIIFVPHLVTVNGLVPLEPCYDFWKHGSFQTAMMTERPLAPRPQHDTHR